MGNSTKSRECLTASRLSDAAMGSVAACYDLGIAYSCGTGGVDIDFIEAHKWFNLAALGGSEAGHALRAEIAREMTARDIAEAQRQARAWIAAANPRAA